MINNIAIYGAGGFGREVALLIRQINEKEVQWNLIGFYDDGKNIGDLVDGLPVLGKLDDLNNVTEPLALVIGIADPAIRQKIVNSILSPKVSYPVLIHPSALTGDLQTNHFGRGSVISAGCILTTSIKVGEFVILNLAVTIGHDVYVHDFVSMMPRVNISGFVTIGHSVYLGSGVIILPHLSLGQRCTVGAGAVVTRDVDSGITVVGVPAVKI